MFVKKSSKKSKSITIPKSFFEKIKEDFTSFLKNLIVNAEINSWDEMNFLKIIGGFFKDDIRKWYIKNKHKF